MKSRSRHRIVMNKTSTRAICYLVIQWMCLSFKKYLMIKSTLHIHADTRRAYNFSRFFLFTIHVPDTGSRLAEVCWTLEKILCTYSRWYLVSFYILFKCVDTYLVLTYLSEKLMCNYWLGIDIWYCHLVCLVNLYWSKLDQQFLVQVIWFVDLS